MVTNKGYFRKTSLPKGRKLPPMKDKYGQQDRRMEYQLFSSDYFSGADVKLYFGDVWVDEVTSITFQLQEEVMPIFGYHSYTYDAIARGKRLLQGSFAINFTSVGYLQQILENANAIFYALEQGEKKGIIQPHYYENMKLSDIMKKLGKETFEEVADEYEQAIWGESKDIHEHLSYADRPYFRQDDLGFDIRIQYGAVSEASNYINGRFYQKAKSEPPNMTVDVINGVQLTSLYKQGIGTESAGAPIQEIYGFMARDLNGISLAHIKQSMSGSDEKEPIDTVYRKMQYGIIR